MKKHNSPFNEVYYTQTTSINPVKQKLRSWLATWKRPPCLAKGIEKLSPGSTVIDVGCGKGEFLKNLISWRRDIQAIGVDWTSATPYEGFHFIRADATSLPIKDGSADLVVCKHLLEHIWQPSHLFRELSRITKRGGHLYLECPDARGLYPFIKPNFYDDPTHIRPYTLNALNRLAELNAFTPIKKGRKRNSVILTGSIAYLPFAILFRDHAFKNGFLIELWGTNIYILAKRN